MFVPQSEVVVQPCLGLALVRPLAFQANDPGPNPGGPAKSIRDYGTDFIWIESAQINCCGSLGHVLESQLGLESL